MRSLALACLVASGCAAARPVAVEVAGIPDGMSLSFWRLRSDVESRLADELAARLRSQPGLSARFELLDAQFGGHAGTPPAPRQISLTYRFVLRDAGGRPVVELAEELLLDGSRLYSPRDRLYWLFKRAILRIGEQVDARYWPRT
jgi:hypothetical protein